MIVDHRDYRNNTKTKMDWVLLLIGLSCGGVIFHTYIGYPLLIYWLFRSCGLPVKKQDLQERCSIVIAAYNEANTLPAKLQLLLASDNEPLIAQILIGSDGSTDGTEAAVEAVGDSRIRVIRFNKRRGKPALLNELIPACGSGIVVLTDARQEIADGAIAGLLRNFADPAVGVVSGELIFRTGTGPSATAVGMDTYWRYEKWIRRAEGQFRSVPGATGALYAIRCDEFRPIPPEMLLDDVAIPMQIICRGWRCVFEPEAVVYDVPSVAGRAEDARKRRTIAGNIQLALRMPELLLPTHNPIWFEFMSHKMIRLLSPLCLLVLLLTTALGTGLGFLTDDRAEAWQWVFRSLFIAQAAFYLLAGFGSTRWGRGTRLAVVAAMFIRLNWVTCLAWLDAWAGRFRVDWQRSSALDTSGNETSSANS